MTLLAIVPVKPLRRGKSRLSTVLSETERTLLNHNLLVSTLKILSSVNRIDQILVVSRDPAALTLAREYDARTVLENGSPELNTALSRAALVAKTYRVNEILILPADLPLLTTKELERVLRLSGNPPEILICPDRRKDGTNLLYINPEGLISFSYGSGSFNKHLELARQSGARVNIISSNSLELDLDTPEDLELMKSIQDQQKQQIDH